MISSTVTPESDIVDWVEISLLSTARAGVVRSVIEKRAALLRSDGGVVDVDGRSPITFNSPPGEYHIMIEHRNHLNIVTETPVVLENGKINGMSFPRANDLWRRQQRWPNQCR